jgi:hypothetical protein
MTQRPTNSGMCQGYAQQRSGIDAISGSLSGRPSFEARAKRLLLRAQRCTLTSSKYLFYLSSFPYELPGIQTAIRGFNDPGVKQWGR